MRYELFVPVEIFSEPNRRDHYRAKASRVKSQRTATFVALHNKFVGRKKPPLPVRVLITRVLGKGQRDFDDDNLAAGCKAVRDEVARFFEVDDREKRKIRFEYGQERGADPSRRPGCRLTITPLEAREKERPE